MPAPMAVEEAVDQLARDPLPNIVLLKQLLAYPEHVKVYRVSGPEGAALLIALDTSASPYDRQAYPTAAIAAFVSSDHPSLTASLMAKIPHGVGVVFKLSKEADLAPVEAYFPVMRRTAFISFTSAHRFEPTPGIRMTSTPSGAAYRLFETQGHDRSWLEPLLREGRAFACVAEDGGEAQSACFAFENFGSVWEVGGVVTAPEHRHRGLGARVVRTALAELGVRGLAPRYQVEEHNTASIALAQSAGLVPFVTITHYAHEAASARSQS